MIVEILLKLKIIKETQNTKLKIGYKFGLEFLNSKYGRKFLSKLKNKIVFADLKLTYSKHVCISSESSERFEYKLFDYSY